jgi:hypothetical protein
MATRKAPVRLTLRQRVKAWWLRTADRRRKYGPVATVAFIAGYVSYGHIKAIAAERLDPRHNMPGVAYLMPVLIDVAMWIFGSIMLSAKTLVGRIAAGVGFMICGALTFAANYLASDPGVIAHVVSATPAVILVSCVVDIELGKLRPKTAAQIAAAQREREARKAAKRGIAPVKAARPVAAGSGVYPTPPVAVNGRRATSLGDLVSVGPGRHLDI